MGLAGISGNPGGDVHDDAVMSIVTTLAAGIDPQDAWSGCAETATS